MKNIADPELTQIHKEYLQSVIKNMNEKIKDMEMLTELLMAQESGEKS
jgi:hypothetical protein